MKVKLNNAVGPGVKVKSNITFKTNVSYFHHLRQGQKQCFRLNWSEDHAQSTRLLSLQSVWSQKCAAHSHAHTWEDDDI